MTRTSFSATTLLLILVFCGQAQAGWHEFLERTKLDWHRNNAWPQPFVYADRLAVCSPFVVMRQNGLCGEFTLGNHHFDPESHALSEAGHLKVMEILRRQPDGPGQVFVVRGNDEEQSAVRLDSVQQSVARAVPYGSLPEVRFVDFGPRGAPASYIDSIGRRLDATVPDPRLPSFSSTTNN